MKAPMTREDAAARRDQGMELAVEKADRDADGWSEDALATIELFSLAHPGERFLGEQVREWGEGAGLIDAPSNARAWGAVFRRAASAGLIKKVGYAPAKSSNLSPKCLWQAAS